MNDKMKRALEEAEGRLNERMDNIEKRQKKAKEMNAEEPEHLKSGVAISELELKKLLKDQNHENTK